MLKKIENPAIYEETHFVQVADEVKVFTKIISKDSEINRTGLYIHGGAFTGNHTMVERPAKWLIDKGFFSKMILIDRRGDGMSSRIEKEFTIFDESEDLKIILDKLDITEKIIVFGNSYGGPIALLLSKIDDRVEKVVLASSSPTLMHAYFPLQILFKVKLMKPLIKFFAFIFTGLKEPKFIDLDFIYELKYTFEYHKIFTKILSHSPRKELQNIYKKIDSVFNEDNLGLPKNIVFDIPVLQVIGSKDEFWGREFPGEYLSNFPNLERIELNNKKHKNVFIDADFFHQKMTDFF